MERTSTPILVAAGLMVAAGLAPSAGAAPQYKDPVLASKSAERKSIEDRFKKADRNGDDKLSRKEANGLLGMDSAGFREADKDKSKDLSKEEYVDWRVKAMQKDLLSLGYTPGALDGNLGPKTRGALRKFAQDEALTGAGTEEIIGQLALKASEESTRKLRGRVEGAQPGSAHKGAAQESARGDSQPDSAQALEEGGAQRQSAETKTASEHGSKLVVNVENPPEKAPVHVTVEPEKGKAREAGPKLSFRELDLDDNGSISWEEAQFSKPVQKHWQQADSNHDGKLSRSEFSALEGRVGTPVGKSAAQTPAAGKGGEGVKPPPSQTGSKRP